MEKELVSSVTLRKMVDEEMINQHHDTAAKSQLSYKKTRSTKEKYQSHKPQSKVRKQTKSHAKQYAKDKHNTGGRPPRWLRIERTRLQFLQHSSIIYGL